MSKIAITLDTRTLSRVDRLVSSKVFPNRSRAIQAAVEDALERIEASRLARECSKLDKKEEQDLADEGLLKDLDEWPTY